MRFVGARSWVQFPRTNETGERGKAFHHRVTENTECWGDCRPPFIQIYRFDVADRLVRMELAEAASPITSVYLMRLLHAFAGDELEELRGVADGGEFAVAQQPLLVVEALV